MIVSWNWLKQYVDLNMPLAELENRLMMAGLNHEGTDDVAGDIAIDLEVTSNRPDCLGHIGIAREVAVLWEQALKIPEATPKSGSSNVHDVAKVTVECPEMCLRYTARVIRGVKVGPSPDWLRQRLATVGIESINNVVDVSNYVLMECGQPLHTFDLAKLEGGQIVVREPKKEETLEAIDHKTYKLEPGMCVIADAKQAVGLGGVMGGVSTEVTDQTTDLLIEAAEFDPTAIRNTARSLHLHSDSSYRFERGIDPEGVDWASRRCCDLILEVAGGELAEGVIDVGQSPATREPVKLRYNQLKRILGIEISGDESKRILQALGTTIHQSSAEAVEVVPPSWRRDITREADLIEEVGRIYGYDAIPEDVSVPMTRSARTDEDRVVTRVREALVACGFDEALTVSAVDETLSEAFSPWSILPALSTQTPVLRRANQLRRSLIPSLLECRRTNESVGNERIELFEIARVYLPKKGGLPEEPVMLGLSSGDDLLAVKGVIEAILDRIHCSHVLEVADVEQPLLSGGQSCELKLGGKPFGILGQVSEEGRKPFQLRGPTTIAELRMDVLFEHAELIPQYESLPQFPAMTRDLNLELDEEVAWANIADLVRKHSGDLLESLEYLETYRDEKRLGKSRKSLLFKITLRDHQGTLTGQKADEIRDHVAAACAKHLGATLRTS